MDSLFHVGGKPFSIGGQLNNLHKLRPALTERPLRPAWDLDSIPLPRPSTGNSLKRRRELTTLRR